MFMGEEWHEEPGQKQERIGDLSGVEQDPGSDQSRKPLAYARGRTFHPTDYSAQRSNARLNVHARVIDRGKTTSKPIQCNKRAGFCICGTGLESGKRRALLSALYGSSSSLSASVAFPDRPAAQDPNRFPPVKPVQRTSVRVAGRLRKPGTPGPTRDEEL